MKRFVLTTSFCASVLMASAQMNSVEVKWDYRGLDHGLGVGVTYLLGDNFEFAPSASVYLPQSKLYVLTAEADLHYKLEGVVDNDNLELYPLIGLGLYRRGQQEEDYTKTYNQLLVNVGGGARWVFTDQWAVFAEEKIQYTEHYANNYFCAGISYRF